MPLDGIADQAAPAGPDRRSLLRNAGIGAAALGALAVSAKLVPAQAQTGPSVADVLNFALNLEYLEAEFYLRATTGQGLPSTATSGVGDQGGVTWGGSMVPFNTVRVRDIAMDIAMDEYNHVLFLRSALGSAAVAEPNINLLTSFNTLARAAGVVAPGGTFNPFANQDLFLLGAYIFEDVGVSAYSGAAGYLTASPSVLAAAAGILAVEAYHAGALRSLLIMLPPTIYTKANKISALRAKLSGAKDDNGPFVAGQANITDSDANSIAYARTPQQVLDVVYGGGAASNYLFFPSKMNGAIS
jgi:hypothetical protein